MSDFEGKISSVKGKIEGRLTEDNKKKPLQSIICNGFCKKTYPVKIYLLVDSQVIVPV